MICKVATSPDKKSLIQRQSPRLKLALTVLSLLIFSGCDRSVEPISSKTDTVNPGRQQLQLADTSQQLWQLMAARAENTIAAGNRLKQSIHQLKSSPSDANLTQAHIAWHDTHQNLMSLNTLLILGDINPGLFSALRNHYLQLETWPLQPGYLDSFSVYAHSGIVNDITIPINADSIRQQHGFTSDSEVSLGLHAMAYLLWGEDQQRTSSAFSSSTPKGDQKIVGLAVSDMPEHRRITILKLQSELLIDDLNALLLSLKTPTSGITHTYFTLGVEVRMQLWRQTINAQTTLLAEQLSSQPNEESHNHFAGQQSSSIGAEIGFIRELLNIAPDTNQIEMYRQLEEIEMTISSWDSGWSEIDPAMRLELSQKLRNAQL